VRPEWRSSPSAQRPPSDLSPARGSIGFAIQRAEFVNITGAINGRKSSLLFFPLVFGIYSQRVHVSYHIVRSVLRRLRESPRDRVIKGAREIRVILYAKDDPFCASAPADELSIEDVLAVEHDVIPLDGADVFQQGEVDSIGDRVALTQDPGDFARRLRQLRRRGNLGTDLRE